MTLRIDPHAAERAMERGATPEEIEDVVRTGVPIAGKKNRLGKFKVYPFGRARNGKRYDQKRIEVYYVEERNTLVTVTVYVFYGKWEC
jgi:hypothetical protein